MSTPRARANPPAPRAPASRPVPARTLPRFRWAAHDRNGKPAQGELHAATPADARAVLRARGLWSIRVTPCPRVGGPRIAATDVARFTRQLATMLKAGIPLLQSIALIARGHPKPRFAQLLSSIRADIEAGSSLAQALRPHPHAFDALYCNLVAAGEEGGVLEPQLERLARQLEASIALRARLRAAMRYPAVVLAVAAIVMAMLIGVVIPAFKDLFASMAGAEAGLPAPTVAVIALSDALVAHWPLAIGAPLLMAAAVRWTLRRSRAAQRLRDRVCLRLPVIGVLARNAVTARWTRTLSTLLAAGLPLIDAMQAAARAAGNAVYRDAIRRAARTVTTGASLAQALRGERLFDEMVLQMVRIGEEAGALDTMLARVAEGSEREVDEAVAALSSLVEPTVIVVLGALIGGMVVAMYLPIFQLAQAL